MARPIAEHYGRAIRQAYSEAKLTQTELADELRRRGWEKVDQTYVSRWARGMVKPDNDVLVEIDDICGRPKGYILELAGYVDAAGLMRTQREALYEEQEVKRAAAAESRERAAAPEQGRDKAPRSA